MTQPRLFNFSLSILKDLRWPPKSSSPPWASPSPKPQLVNGSKRQGDAVKADEALAELETDKVTLEVNAPAAGIISEIIIKEGETVAVGTCLVLSSR